MPSPPIDVHCDAPDPADEPQTFVEACAIIDRLLRAEQTGAEAYLPYVVSNTQPGVDDQDKVWIQLDSAGRPIATKTYYNGNWRPVYSGQASEVKMFTGDPAPYFDTTGRGKIGTSWDGWALMNGQNGTPNWTDRFICGAHMTQSGGVAMFSGGWQSNVEGSPTKIGGFPSVLLSAGYLPREAKDPVIVDLFSATGDARSDTGSIFGKHALATGANGQVELIPGQTARPADSFSNLPPYVVTAYVQFVGYL